MAGEGIAGDGLPQELDVGRHKARPILKLLLQGAVVEICAADGRPSACLSVRAFADKVTSTMWVPPDDKNIAACMRIPATTFAKEAVDACVDVFNASDELLGKSVLLLPLFVYTGGTCVTGVSIATIDGSGDPFFLLVPRTTPRRNKGDETSRQLSRRIQNYLWNNGNKDKRQGEAAVVSILFTDVLETVWFTSRNWNLTTVQSVFNISRVAPPRQLAGKRRRRKSSPATTFPRDRPMSDTVVKYARALGLHTAQGTPGSSLRNSDLTKEHRRALKAMLLTAPPDMGLPVHADVDAWMQSTLAILSDNPRARIVLPLAGVAIPASVIGAPLPRARQTTAVMAALQLHLKQTNPEVAWDINPARAGAIPGELAPVFQSIRGVLDTELIANARENTESVRPYDVPKLFLPTQVFDERGIHLVAEHVEYHARDIPNILSVPLEPLTVDGHRDTTCDIDGLGINIRHCPAGLKDYIAKMIAYFESEDATEHAIADVADDAESGDICKALAERVLSATADLRRVYAERSEGFNPAQALREGDSRKRPELLAIAAAATLLQTSSLKLDARAAVRVIVNIARSHHFDQSGIIVRVPANGKVELSKKKPTVNSSFINGTDGTYALPTDTGMSNEPFKVYVVGVDSSAITQAVRDVLAVFVHDSSASSTSVVCAEGLATRGPNDVVEIGGGCLLSLSVLALLLYRHAKPSSVRPFAIIKS